MPDTRLLMISVDALPRIGGISNFAHFSGNALAARHQAAYFLGPRGTSIPRDMKADYKLIVDHSSNTKNRNGRAYVKEIERLEALIDKIVTRHQINRILLFHAFYYGPPALNIARKHNINCNIVVHGTELTSQFPEIIEKSDTLRATDTGSRTFHLFSALNRATHLIANSQFTATLAKRIAPAAPVLVSGCGIAEDIYYDLKNRFQFSLAEKQQQRSESLLTIEHPAAKSKDRKRPQICYVGRFVPHKRIEAIFDLLQHMDADLVIIGDGPHKNALKKALKESGQKDKVTFLGKLNDQEKWQHMAQSDFLMLPSRYHAETGGYEGFGIVLLEAVAAGTIPVCSGHEGTADPVHHYAIGLEGLSARKSPQETAQTMLDYIRNPAKYQAKVDADCKTIETSLFWDKVAENLAIKAS